MSGTRSADPGSALKQPKPAATERSVPLTERYIRIANLDKRNTTEGMGL